jgi:hypothetical protein
MFANSIRHQSVNRPLQPFRADNHLRVYTCFCNQETVSVSAMTAALFERYAGEPVTTTRRYAIPATAVKEIRNITPVYGSQGRAIQVGAEILIRQKRRVKVSIDEQKVTRITYKLLPRTIEVIERLTGKYGSHAAVFGAIHQVLIKDDC